VSHHMRKALIAAACAALALGPAQTSAQSAQEQLDARYDRALAAGYKALFLCSAIANAEANGASRTPESVHQWELTGIYPTLDPIIRDLEWEITRYESDDGEGMIARVAVEYGDGEKRFALYALEPGNGCAVQPIGFVPDPDQSAFILSGLPPIREHVWQDDPGALDGRELYRLSRDAFDGHYGEGSRTTGVVVLRQGALALEEYAPDFGPNVPQRTWSVAKSVAATVVGAAVQRGDADVHASAGLGVDEADPRRVITIDHALRMATGRYSDTPGNRTDPLYWGGTTVDERAANWPMLHEPGTVYRYANNDTLAAIRAIRESFDAHPPGQLFNLIGMTNTVAETDWQGGFVLSSQVWSTARDLALLGQLHLDDGVLPDGTRILPEGWVEYVSTPSGPQPEGRSWGYGAGWWLFNNHEGIPTDTFFAAGNRGQYVVVVPSRDVVIVRRGEDMVGTRFDIEAFTRDILAALDE